jgi:FAD/FMN-containing dehydrogenase
MVGAAPDWRSLAEAIDGAVVEPGSTEFDRIPPTFNARFHDRRPVAIVRCAGPEDVSEAIGFATRHGVEMAIRSGGHCFAGRSSTGGMVIDVGPMGSVSVSGDQATMGAGARLGEVYDALQVHGRTIPGGTCPPVGIAGLTLGGGLGILGRKHGLTSDQLVGAKVVLADGRILDCDEHHDEDLFWALRGAGAGNFGVVTSLVLQTVPAPEVTNFHAAWPFSHAARVIDAWQGWAPVAPDELAASLKVTASGEIDRPPAVDVFGAHQGTESGAAGLLEELAARAGLDPASSSLALMSYPETRRYWADLGAEAKAEGEPVMADPAQPYLFARSEFFGRPLPAEAIEAVLDAFVRERIAGVTRELDFMPWGGAYNRVSPDATAFVHRRELFQLKHATVVEEQGSIEGRDGAAGWVARSWRSVHPWGSGRVFPNFADPDLEGWADAYYGPNFPRLVRVKARYDGSNSFRFHQSVPVA